MNLVTGAAGHLGNVLVRELLAAGKKVRALVMPGEDKIPLTGLDIDLVEGNVLDQTSLQKAFEGVENVYHLAGLISIMPGEHPLMNLVNVNGTRNVVFTARQVGVRRLIYTSSIHAIRRVPHGVRIDESIPFDPQEAISPYDHSKAQASLEVLRAAQEGLDAVIVCPTGVIGPYDFRLSEMGQLILDCVRRKPQFYVEGGYDFVDVRDIARGQILASEKGKSGETYILSGELITVRGLLDTVRSITGKRFPKFKVPISLAVFAARFTPLYYRLVHSRPRFTPYSLETIRSNADISHAKATQDLGYSPRPLNESLRDTIQWLLENSQRLLATAPR